MAKSQHHRTNFHLSLLRFRLYTKLMTCEICKQSRATHRKLVPQLGRMAYVCGNCGTTPKSVISVSSGPGFFSIKTTTTHKADFSSLSNHRASKNIICPNCAWDIDAINHTGKLGCSVCYKTFEAALAPIINDIHGGL